MKTIRSQGSNGAASSHHPGLSNNHNTRSNGAGTFQTFKPRANPPPIKAIELMGINLHEEKEPSRDVETSEVTMMRSRMAHHSEETNELFNLMARQIKKRAEERINLYTVENAVEKKEQAPKIMDQNEMDNFLLNNDSAQVKLDFTKSPVATEICRPLHSTSRGNSPPK